MCKLLNIKTYIPVIVVQKGYLQYIQCSVGLFFQKQVLIHLQWFAHLVTHCGGPLPFIRGLCSGEEQIRHHTNLKICSCEYSSDGETFYTLRIGKRSISLVVCICTSFCSNLFSETLKIRSKCCSTAINLWVV